MTTEAQQLLDAAFAGKLDLDADAGQATQAAPADTGTDSPTATEVTPADAPAGATAAQDDERAGAPIASKSGEYTIPYEKLTQARQERDTIRAENEQLKAQLAQLTADQAKNIAVAQEQAQARADAGQTPTDADKNLAVAQAAAAQGVDMTLFGDFSEEEIARGVTALVEQRAAALVDAKLKDALAPLQQRDARSSADAHRAAIYEAHKDADEIYESAEFKKWIDEQPGFARSAIEQALSGGEAPQVIEVFSAFKATGGKAAPQEAVAKALEAAKAQPPASLSELPGAASTSDAERVAQLSGDPAKLLDFMAGLSPEKQNRLMNSVV
ncbi:hypothetical protein [Pulveribacter sp.]|uniref:hypothetical protein n=1 Tax=Pulveribacter sp. TaxID=2678893 RepID=UPI0028A6C840|nr:hypothetical protein [Pulveribacter sp.]